MSLTRISIVIPTHKRPKLLLHALNSALGSIEQNDEIIIVSDHDPTAKQTLAHITDKRVRLVDNNDKRGAAATRNIGVQSARGDIIVFLDDDDELLTGYTEKIMSAVVKHNANWGFASQLKRLESKTGALKLGIASSARGFLGDSTPFRKKLGALSAGFWIRRELFISFGGLCELQLVDEDTDLCCRLIAKGHAPWFTPEPATILDRNPDIPRLTNASSNDKIAECYLRTFERNYQSLKGEAGAATFLALRAQRNILRCGWEDLLQSLVGLQINIFVSSLLWSIRTAKKLKGFD